MNIEKESIFQDAITSCFNLFTGAGFSVLSEDKNGDKLPLSSELSKELVDRFGRGDLSNLSLDKISTIIRSVDEEGFESYIEERFKVEEYDDRYESMTNKNINIDTIFTTNVDDLIYKIYEGSEHWYANDVDYRGPKQDKEAVDVYTLHGSVKKEDRNYTFSTTEVAASFNRDPDRWFYLINKLEESPTLFWGHSISSPGILESLSPEKNNSKSFSDIWITVHPSVGTSTVNYYKALGFKIIGGKTGELLDYFGYISDQVVGGSAGPTTEQKFVSEKIPDFGEVPVRSINQFYLGDAPTWYDVFSEKIYKTSHYDDVRDRIYNDEDLIITGLLACGKSTLMMQVAHGINYDGYKLFLDSPTNEKAKLILRKLGRENALIFVDDVSSSIEAFATLSSAVNVQVVGADRDYLIDSIYHKISSYSVSENIVDVTDLSDYDVQQIVSSIPEELRVESPVKRTETESGEDLSVFEIVDENIKAISLRDRFRGSMHDLKDENDLLLEFLLVTCYVQRCRTKMSLGMLIAFFRGDAVSYSDLYDMRDKIGRILSDYVGKIKGAQQDFYSPRSNIVAEAVINQAPKTYIKNVIKKFHSNVSPMRIHRADTFQRNAYSHKIMRKVFDNWKEGKEFYRHIYDNRRPSPYVLQQASLYLRDKDQYNEAFSMIDEAKSSADPAPLSIKNTYARILFEANIRHDSPSNEIRKALNESMEILEDCYHQDDSKAHHVTSYAHQSIRYSQKFDSDRAKKYLRKAFSWLQAEVQRSNWNRGVKSLHDEVKRHINNVMPGYLNE